MKKPDEEVKQLKDKIEELITQSYTYKKKILDLEMEINNFQIENRKLKE